MRLALLASLSLACTLLGCTGNTSPPPSSTSSSTGSTSAASTTGTSGSSSSTGSSTTGSASSSATSSTSTGSTGSTSGSTGSTGAQAIWQREASPSQANLWGVWAADESHAWIVGEQATLLHLSDAGWVPNPIAPDAGDLLGVWGSSASDVWAVGGTFVMPGTEVDGGLYGSVSHWDGAAWTTTRVPRQLRAVSGADAAHVWAASYTDLYQLTPSGAAPVLHTDCELLDVWAQSPSLVWLADASPTALQWSGDPDAGAGCSTPMWTQQSIWGTSGSDVWLYTLQASADVPYTKLRHWDGASWSEMDTYNSLQGQTFEAVWGEPGRGPWLVGDQIWLDTDAGWQPESHDPAAPGGLLGIGGAGDAIWAVGFQGTILRRHTP